MIWSLLILFWILYLKNIYSLNKLPFDTSFRIKSSCTSNDNQASPAHRARWTNLTINVITEQQSLADETRLISSGVRRFFVPFWFLLSYTQHFIVSRLCQLFSEHSPWPIVSDDDDVDYGRKPADLAADWTPVKPVLQSEYVYLVSVHCFIYEISLTKLKVDVNGIDNRATAL